MFKHLYSGNHFCYVKSLHKAIQRYVIYNMLDPMQMNNLKPGLIDLKIVVYHEGQDINCSSCLSDDHQVQECPERQNKRRDSRRDYRCNEIGRIARNCDYDNKNEAVVGNEKNSPQSDSCLANKRVERVMSHVGQDGAANNTDERNRQEIDNTQENGQKTNITVDNEQKL